MSAERDIVHDEVVCDGVDALQQSGQGQMIGGQSRQTKSFRVSDDQGHSHVIGVGGGFGHTRDNALLVAGRWQEHFYNRYGSNAVVYERIERSTTTIIEEKIG